VSSASRTQGAQPLEGEPAARVLVAGATGFAGALAARLVWRHPRLELVRITGRSDVGRRLDDLYPRHRVPLVVEELDSDSFEGIDAALVAYPHGAAAPLVAQLRERGVRVVDLSADFRLRELGEYERWYGPHPEPGLLDGAVYGLPELYREALGGAELVANPGCYPTCAVLALAPMARAGLIEGVVVDAKSGVSGAGRNAQGMHFSLVGENFSPYKVRGHRHSPEIRQELEALGMRGPLTFVPHLLPLDQGLLASCYVTLARETDESELRALYEESYAAEPFVELADAPPGVLDVRETNLCRICVAVPPDGGRALVFAAIDNLWKGAAGQAVQNLNLMLGLPEGEGLL
jgi:N-acetyl-gamma-glutamyl-phosphate reductase